MPGSIKYIIYSLPQKEKKEHVDFPRFLSIQNNKFLPLNLKKSESRWLLLLVCELKHMTKKKEKIYPENGKKGFNRK